jgi:hypothetical protein
MMAEMIKGNRIGLLMIKDVHFSGLRKIDQKAVFLPTFLQPPAVLALISVC